MIENSGKDKLEEALLAGTKGYLSSRENEAFVLDVEAILASRRRAGLSVIFKEYFRQLDYKFMIFVLSVIFITAILLKALILGISGEYLAIICMVVYFAAFTFNYLENKISVKNRGQYL
ncbi:MAG: hypothetical protein V1752_07720 [Candidatus Firestonebacteria bacterium]